MRFLTEKKKQPKEKLNVEEVKRNNKERRKKNKSFNLFFYESTNWFD